MPHPESIVYYFYYFFPLTFYNHFILHCLAQYVLPLILKNYLTNHQPLQTHTYTNLMYFLGQIFEVEILMDLHVFRYSVPENHIFIVWSVCVCVCVCVCVLSA